jgi:hypothetical protein
MIFLLFLLSATTALCKGAGTVAALSLRLPHSVFAVSCANISTAAFGAGAIFYNPALLAREERHLFSLMYNEWIFGTKRGSICYTKGGKTAFGAGASYLLKENIIGDDDVFSFFNLSAAFAICARKGLYSLGASIKVLHEGTAGLDEEIESNVVVCADFGLAIRWHSSLFSICWQNIGTPLKYESEADPLPSQLKVGACILANDFMKIHAEGVFPREKSPYLLFGTSVRVLDFLMLQAGYEPAREKASAGFSIFRENVQFEYAYIPGRDLEDTYFLGISFFIEEKEDELRRKIEELRRLYK